eukprot:m.300578 g.300578  ORF g.300578 m.300578 type:complete len:106 (+) comp40800_c1_seq19:448-765(+)
MKNQSISKRPSLCSCSGTLNPLLTLFGDCLSLSIEAGRGSDGSYFAAFWRLLRVTVGMLRQHTMFRSVAETLLDSKNISRSNFVAQLHNELGKQSPLMILVQRAT